jgi:hypothetical protein
MAQAVFLRQKSASSNYRVRRVIEFVTGGILGFDTTGKITALTPFTNPVFSGKEVLGAEGGVAGKVELTNQKTAVDNTNAGLFRVSIPNAINAGALEVVVSGVLGDGDSTDSKKYIVSFSRIAGANALVAISSAVGAAATTGATANAVTTGTMTAVAGGVTAVNTFDFQAKVARSAGAATNHVISARAILLNSQASGITIAAL